VVKKGSSGNSERGGNPKLQWCLSAMVNSSYP